MIPRLLGGRYGLSALLRLLIQALAAVLTIHFGGFGIESIVRWYIANKNE